MDEDNIYPKLADEIKKELEQAIFPSLWPLQSEWTRLSEGGYAIKNGSKIQDWIVQHPESEYIIRSFGEHCIIYNFSEQMETWFLLRWS